MKTLPVVPVETLATALRMAAPADNGGIVPPWLEVQTTNRNPGIVPPWLQGRPVAPTEPVDDDTPRILTPNAAQPTAFDPAPVHPDLDPDTPRIW